MWFKVFILDECLYQICSEVFEYNPCLCYQESLFNYFTRMVFTTSFYLSRGFPVGSAGKESACNAGDLGSIPGLGRCPGEGNGYPFQYSGLENSVDCIVYGVAKSWTQLSDFHFHFFFLKKEVAAHSSILAWEMPWTEEPRGLQFMGSQRVGHDLATEHEHTRVI